MWYNNDVACQMTYKNVDYFIRGGVVMKRSTKKKLLCVVIMLCALCISGKEQKVYAAKSGYVHFDWWNDSKDKTNNKYDVTGDGKADVIRASLTTSRDNNDYGTLQIFINDVLAYNNTIGDCLGWTVNLIHLKNGKTFFDITCIVINDHEEIHELFEYKDGKLVSIYDFLKDYSKYTHFYGVNIRKVKGNSIYYVYNVQFLSLGGFKSYNIKYVYKDGKIKRTSNYYPIIYNSAYKNKWTVNRKIKVYKKPGNKKVIYTLKKGNKIKIYKVVYKNKKVYFQIKNKNGKGKTGYIPATTKYPRKKYFKESFYSG